MKKISFIALGVALCSGVFAQDGPKLKKEMAERPYFGVKAGANIAKFRTENFSGNINNKVSMNGGFLANIPLGGSVKLQPELIYLGAGGKVVTTDLLGVTTTSEQDLHYVSLPLMVQFYPAKGFFIELGPQASYLVAAERSGTGSNEDNNKSNFSNFDIAANGGLGFISRIGLGVNARYSYGLTNILSDAASNGAKLNNSGIQVGLFYLFGANK